MAAGGLAASEVVEPHQITGQLVALDDNRQVFQWLGSPQLGPKNSRGMLTVRENPSHQGICAQSDRLGPECIEELFPRASSHCVF